MCQCPSCAAVRARPALVCLCVVGAALLCTPCSGTWVLITVFCLLQHLPSRGSQSVLQTLINLASQPSCEVGGGCHPAVQMRTLSCSGTVASLLPLKPGEATAPSRPSRSLARPTAPQKEEQFCMIQRWPELTASCSTALLLSPSCSRGFQPAPLP